MGWAFLRSKMMALTAGLAVISALVPPLALAASDFAAATDSKAPVIDDELVRGLRCERLNVNEIYRAITPDAFGPQRSVPIRNFTSLFLGQCWAIARFQRLALLLGRVEEKGPYNPQKISRMVLAKQHTPLPGVGIQIRRFSSEPLTVFHWPDVEAEDYFNPLQSKVDRVEKDLGHSLDEELKAAQKYLFYRSGNLALIGKKPSNAELGGTIGKIVSLVRGHRLPLINIRMGRFSQHVVVGKTFEKTAEDEWTIHVIDYNSIDDTEIRISRVDGKYTVKLASVSGFAYDDAENVEGIYLVEEGERPSLDKALLDHYTRACDKRRAPSK
jgi:hypothetical protein